MDRPVGGMTVRLVRSDEQTVDLSSMRSVLGTVVVVRNERFISKRDTL
jgi:hypothetical protein